MISEHSADCPRRGASRLALAWAVLWAGASACATLDLDHAREESYALRDTADTRLATQLSRLPAGPPHQSGFHLLEEGVDALAARLAMARLAERGIDARYDRVADDTTGSAFVGALLAAAERGVRVRLLIEDIETAGHDPFLWLLDQHPHIEVRAFDPFASGRLVRPSPTRAFRRASRHMHGKSFTVDHQLAVIGGRSIADEYFAAREDASLGDLDVLCVGPVVREVSEVFDEHWNHPLALPVPVFLDAPRDVEEARERLGRRLDEQRADPAASDYRLALDSDAGAWLEALGDSFTWCPYALVYASPDRGLGERRSDPLPAVAPLTLALDAAQGELLVVSPYFVPRRAGVEHLRGLVQRGLRVRIVTNSLAASDEAVVHAGYGPSRRPLLEHGVELFEVRPRGSRSTPGTRAARATLHTRAFVVDRRQVFLGSFDLHPRSLGFPTDMGLVLESEAIAAALVREIEEQLPEATYRVWLDRSDRLRWSTWEEGEQIVYRREPATSFWRRFVTVFLGTLPIDAPL